MKNNFFPANILLPKADFEKWAVVACDQYTSEPEYWKEVENFVGQTPSAYNIILPECYLSNDNSQRIEKINKNMQKYLDNGVFQEVDNSFIYVERTLADGKLRRGIIGLIDLEDYSYIKGEKALIRSTEATVLERIPPRVEIRKNAPLEMPHIMLLIDDKNETVIEPLAQKSADFEKVYELSPDVLITHAELTKSVMENLKTRNITVVLLTTPTKYSEVAPYYMALSKLFLGEERYNEAYDPYIGESERIISETKKSLSSVTKRVALYVEEGFVATGDTIAGEAMQRAGMINIAADQTDYMMSFAEIKAADPEVIFCPEGLSEIILKEEIYKDITAVKNGAVYEVDVEALVYASEGFAATIQSMSKYLLQ